jgi:hypothetical protein
MLPITIKAGQSISDALDLTPFINVGKFRAVRLVMPSAWTAATITFLVSDDLGVSYKKLYDGGNTEYELLSANINRTINLDPSVFDNILNFKIQSGTTALPVNQAVDAIINVVYANQS